MDDEYISTETGCQYLRKYKIEDGTSFLYDEGFNDGIETAISCIGSEVPAADVRPVVHGEWKKAFADHEAFGVRPFYRYCSKCNEASVHQYNFCPNCGADMKGENQ